MRLRPPDRRATYNVGLGVNYSVHEIFERVATLLGKPIEPVYKPDLPGEADSTLADITAARGLGWAPKVDLTAGLERSIAYVREHVIERGLVLSDVR